LTVIYYDAREATRLHVTAHSLNISSLAIEHPIVPSGCDPSYRLNIRLASKMLEHYAVTVL